MAPRYWFNSARKSPSTRVLFNPASARSSGDSPSYSLVTSAGQTLRRGRSENPERRLDWIRILPI